MSLVFALLFAAFSTALVIRLVQNGWVLVLLLVLFVSVLGALKAETLPLAAALLAGLGVAWSPKAKLGAKPRRRAAKKRQPKPKRPTTPISGMPPGLERRYEILEKIGIGGMATVYKAKSKDGKMVALKIPQEKYVGDTRFVRRFHREAEVLQHLNHQAIVKVLDHGNEGDTHFIAMEYLDGEGFDRLIENRKLTIKAVAQIMVRVAEALQHIHTQGIIHRDIKPGNVMVLKSALKQDGSLDPQGVRLMDFGIAAGKVLSRLTVTGARIGTPVYMSPEQAKGMRIDHKSDIYSYGVVFYEALCGQPPFQGSYEAVIHQQITQMPTPPKQVNPEIPQVLSDMVQRTLEKDPAKRPNLGEVIKILQGDWEQDPGLQAPVYLALAVEAKKGTIRLMEPGGMLARMFSGVGSGRGMFPSPPLSMAVDTKGNFWISLFEYGGGAARLVHRFSPEGELELSISPYGTKPGEALYPVSLSTSQDSLYVLDGETCLVTHYDLEGSMLGRFGGVGKGRGTFDTPRMILAGNQFLYVLDYGNRQVQRLTLEGAYRSRYAYRKSKESEELRVLSGIGLGPDDQLFIFDADSQKVRRVSLEGEVESSFTVPSLEGEDSSSLVEFAIGEEFIYVGRRGSSRIHRFKHDGEPVAPLDIYAPLRSLGLWHNVVQPVRSQLKQGVPAKPEAPDFSN
ncbi:MAG: protein kinase [Deinococcus sp.]|nr:protein kinase [Deinococcus sp.]